MKKVIFDRKISSYFYIETVNNKVLIVAVGPDSPFYFPASIVKSIEDASNRLHRKSVDIYFDLLSCAGDSTNRFLKFVYRRGSNVININQAQTVKRSDLPADLKDDLHKFYRTHFSEFSNHSILTCSEIEKLSVDPV